MTIDRVTKRFEGIGCMSHAQAGFLRELILTHSLRNLLELGTHHGKSAAYMAAILEEAGRGKLTTLDRSECLELTPSVFDLLSALGLRHRVEVRVHRRSYTMTLLAMLEATPRERFDFCYFDGGHTWDVTGFAFLLVDLMLAPGGWVVFDDLDWTLAAYIDRYPRLAEKFRSHTDEELRTPQVRKVFELLLPGLGYRNIAEPLPNWGIARKAESPRPASPPLIETLRSLLSRPVDDRRPTPVPRRPIRASRGSS